jgi:hypothetical protein
MLLRHPPASLFGVDLYTALPKAKSEAVYAKAECERELEVARKEARA